MSFGQTLRNAREAKGLSLSKVAADTRILVQIIADMENEDFHRIPAAIYGRGFVRLFAEEVGLDPAPLVHEFMEIFQGRRPPKPATSLQPPPAATPAADVPPAAPPFTAPEVDVPPPVTPFAPPPAETEPLWDPEPGTSAADNPFVSPIKPEPLEDGYELPPAVPPPPPPAPPKPAPAQATRDVEGLPLFDTSDPVPAAKPAARPAPASGAGLPPQIDADSPYLASSTYEGPSATRQFCDSISVFSSNIIQRVNKIPRRAWRLSLLVCIALLVAALMAWGCIKLYQATARLPPNLGADGASEIDLTKKEDVPTAKQPDPAATAKTPAKAAAPATRPAPAPAPGKLRTTGQKVPSLYMD